MSQHDFSNLMPKIIVLAIGLIVIILLVLILAQILSNRIAPTITIPAVTLRKYHRKHKKINNHLLLESKDQITLKIPLHVYEEVEI